MSDFVLDGLRKFEYQLYAFALMLLLISPLCGEKKEADLTNQFNQTVSDEIETLKTEIQKVTANTPDDQTTLDSLNKELEFYENEQKFMQNAPALLR